MRKMRGTQYDERRMCGNPFMKSKAAFSLDWFRCTPFVDESMNASHQAAIIQGFLKRRCGSAACTPTRNFASGTISFSTASRPASMPRLLWGHVHLYQAFYHDRGCASLSDGSFVVRSWSASEGCPVRRKQAPGRTAQSRSGLPFLYSYTSTWTWQAHRTKVSNVRCVRQ